MCLVSGLLEPRYLAGSTKQWTMMPPPLHKDGHNGLEHLFEVSESYSKTSYESLNICGDKRAFYCAFQHCLSSVKKSSSGVNVYAMLILRSCLFKYVRTQFVQRCLVAPKPIQ